MIEVKGVTKVYRMGEIDLKALRDVTLQIQQGDFLALAGPSGSGKTTLLNIIGCLDTPSEGDVLIDGQSIAGLSQRKKVKLRRDKIGFIFQNFNLIPVLSVYENVEYPLLLTNTKSSERKKMVQKALADVGLQDRAKHFPNELSGGERQRVAIARALVKNPMIILADEPTANLDSKTGIKIIELMQKLNEEEQVTFVFSSHDDRVLERTKKIIHISDGEISA